MTVATHEIKIKLEPSIIEAISKIAKDKNTTKDNIINEALKKEFVKNKIPDHLILNKNTYNPDHDRRMSFSGIIKTKEPFNTQKTIDDVRKMEY